MNMNVFLPITKTVRLYAIHLIHNFQCNPILKNNYTLQRKHFFLLKIPSSLSIDN